MPLEYVFAIPLLIVFRYALIRCSNPLWSYLSAGPWGDAICYFLQTQYYRRNSGAEVDPRCLFRGKTLHTPSWYQKLIGKFFSDSQLWSMPWLPNMVLYSIGIIAFLLVLAVFVNESSRMLTLVAIIFSAQADNSRFDKLSIHYLTIQPRFLGLLSLSLYALIFAAIPTPIVSGILGSLVLLVAINTSVFSRQVAYSVVPLTGLLAWDVTPIFHLLGATALSLLVNKEEFVKSFQAQYRYTKWYFNNFYQTRPGTGLEYLIRKTFAPSLKDISRYIDSLVAMVLLFIVLNEFDDPFARRCMSLIASAVVICMLTAFRRFASLGECWRYLSFYCYFVTPTAIAYCIIKSGTSNTLSYCLASVFLFYNLHRSFSNSEIEVNPLGDIHSMLNVLPNGSHQMAVWWSSHYRYGSIPVALGYGASTFEFQGTDLSEEAMKRFFANYPYLNYNEKFLDKYKVTHLLVSKKEWPENLYGPLANLIKDNRVLAENDNFVIMARATKPSFLHPDFA